MISSICVFCGAAVGNNPLYQEAAVAVGKEFATRRIRLVYGGGSRGLMGLMADAALELSGYVIGIIPETLVRAEVQHRGVSEVHVVKTLHERKAMMADKADAFLALPGGFGTYEELLEIITWTQLGIYSKPIVLYNINNYFEPFFKIAEHGVAEGFIRPIDPHLIRVAYEIPEIFSLMENFPPQNFRPKWADKSDI